VSSAVVLAPIGGVVPLIRGRTAPLGSLLTGFLLSGLGGPATCAVLGTTLLLIAAVATATPTLRHADLPTAVVPS
jgi:hypothetical protein